MKTVLPGLVLVVALAGCATTGATADNRANAASALNSDPGASSPLLIPAPSSGQNLMPQIILPATGGAPIIGIPIGGNMFIPANGGPPVIGIPTSP